MALLKYTLLRLALLGVTAGVLYVVGLRDWLLLLVALLLSGIISIFALNRARDEVSTSLTTRRTTIERRLDEAGSAQDEPGGEPEREP